MSVTLYPAVILLAIMVVRARHAFKKKYPTKGRYSKNQVPLTEFFWISCPAFILSILLFVFFSAAFGNRIFELENVIRGAMSLLVKSTDDLAPFIFVAPLFAVSLIYIADNHNYSGKLETAKHAFVGVVFILLGCAVGWFFSETQPKFHVVGKIFMTALPFVSVLLAYAFFAEFGEDTPESSGETQGVANQDG